MSVIERDKVHPCNSPPTPPNTRYPPQRILFLHSQRFSKKETFVIVDGQKYSLSASIELLSFGLLDFGLVSLNPAQPPLFFLRCCRFLVYITCITRPFFGELHRSLAFAIFLFFFCAFAFAQFQTAFFASYFTFRFCYYYGRGRVIRCRGLEA